MQHYILENGKPIPVDIVTFAKWNMTANRRVDFTIIEDGVEVSTVFLGLDHNFSSKGPPILYETMVFRNDKGAECERYTSLIEAKAGHWRMVDKLRVK